MSGDDERSDQHHRGCGASEEHSDQLKSFAVGHDALPGSIG
jgi:hypothetical protein